jgi:uncharacterized membrane protein
MSGNSSSPSPPSSDAELASGSGGRIWPVLPVVFLVGLLFVGVILWGFMGTGSWKGPAPLFWPIFPLGFILFAAIFLCLRFGGWGDAWRADHHGQPGHSAREILRQRYARGELSRAQFQEMMAALELSEHTPMGRGTP